MVAHAHRLPALPICYANETFSKSIFFFFSFFSRPESESWDHNLVMEWWMWSQTGITVSVRRNNEFVFLLIFYFASKIVRDCVIGMLLTCRRSVICVCVFSVQFTLSASRITHVCRCYYLTGHYARIAKSGKFENDRLDESISTFGLFPGCKVLARVYGPLEWCSPRSSGLMVLVLGGRPEPSATRTLHSANGDQQSVSLDNNRSLLDCVEWETGRCYSSEMRSTSLMRQSKTIAVCNAISFENTLCAERWTCLTDARVSIVKQNGRWCAPRKRMVCLRTMWCGGADSALFASERKKNPLVWIVSFFYVNALDC